MFFLFNIFYFGHLLNNSFQLHLWGNSTLKRTNIGTTTKRTVGNGNMLSNKNTVNTSKNKTFTYNLLNLPQQVTVATGTSTFIYDATGNKLRKITALGTAKDTLDYIRGIQYKNRNIDFIQTEEGKIAFNKTTGVYDYEYYLGDNLGNTRVTFNIQNGVATALQRDDYMPFGYEISNGSPANPKNEYLYNKKELQEELGEYDFGRRFYDPLIGRWNVPDPKTQLLEMSSPYVYALNSPICFLDKDGELPIFINGRTSDENRAQAFYWDMSLINTIKGSGIPNPGGTIMWVDGNQGFAYDNGNKHLSHDYALAPQDRNEAGKMEAAQDFDKILSQLEKDPNTGKIIEKIQIYTHSRGGAFGAGYTEKLLELIKENADKFEDANHEIDFVLNMAPHQSWGIKEPEGVDSFSIDHNGDLLSGGHTGNNIAFQTSTGGIGLAPHSDKSFVREVGAFLKVWKDSKGDKEKIINDFIKKLRSYGIKVTVKD